VSDWEGGVRVNAWVSGGFLPAGARGTKVEGYMHIADWCDETRSVFVESSAERVRSFACGPGLRRSASSRAWCPPTPQQQPQGCRLWTRSGSSRKRFFLSQRKSEFCAREIFLPVDSMWPMIVGTNSTSPRTRLHLTPNTLIEGDYKLIAGRSTFHLGGPTDQDGWTGSVYPNGSSGVNGTGGLPGAAVMDCTAGCASSESFGLPRRALTVAMGRFVQHPRRPDGAPRDQCPAAAARAADAAHPRGGEPHAVPAACGARRPAVLHGGDGAGGLHRAFPALKRQALAGCRVQMPRKAFHSSNQIDEIAEFFGRRAGAGE